MSTDLFQTIHSPIGALELVDGRINIDENKRKNTHFNGFSLWRDI